MSFSNVLTKHLRDYKKSVFTNPNLPSVKRFLPKESVLIVSPHPDDEILMSGFALRLQNENSMNVVNVAVTLGSNKDRVAQRKRELSAAIKFLGWKNFILSEDWNKKENELNKIIEKVKPRLIIAPHQKDWHPTHIRTSSLLRKSLPKRNVYIAWAEYWKPQDRPNLLVEVPAEITIKQVKALECHKGEILRNPYHTSLHGWQMDNVRRGSEWLSKKGSASSSMLAGQLYCLEKYIDGNKKPIKAINPFAYFNNDLTDWLS